MNHELGVVFGQQLNQFGENGGGLRAGAARQGIKVPDCVLADARTGTAKATHAAITVVAIRFRADQMHASRSLAKRTFIEFWFLAHFLTLSFPINLMILIFPVKHGLDQQFHANIDSADLQKHISVEIWQRKHKSTVGLRGIIPSFTPCFFVRS